MRKLLILFCFLYPLVIQAQIITTYAGNGILGYAGDGGPATNASLNAPLNVFFDNNGDLLICHHNLIRKVQTSTGNISTIAGNPSAASIADGSQATAALIDLPYSICSDAVGNLYIADYWAIEIRKIDIITGIITNYAGTSLTAGYSGDGGPATASKLSGPVSLCIDTSRRILYISDEYNFRIRKIDMVTGIISTFAGIGINGFSIDGTPATNAQLSRTWGICLDKEGNLYVSEWDNARIRKIDINSGLISTVAGNGSIGYSGDGGSATNAMMSQPGGLCIDSCGNLYFSDGAIGGGNYRIRKIDGATKTISTVAGNGSNGFFGDGSLAINAKLSRTYGICLDKNGNLYVADIDNRRIRKISQTSNCYGNLDVSNVNSTTAYIYPSPANDLLHVDGINSTTTYRLLSIVGTSLQQGTLQSGSNAVSIATLPPGIYLLELTDENKRTITKIVKQ